MADKSKEAEIAEFKVNAKIVGEKIIAMQEKCNMWNQILPYGRRQCREAKMELYNDFISFIIKNGDNIDAMMNRR